MPSTINMACFRDDMDQTLLDTWEVTHWALLLPQGPKKPLIWPKISLLDQSLTLEHLDGMFFFGEKWIKPT